MSDTNTKTFLNRIMPRALPSYARTRMSAYKKGKRKYHPIRMMMTVLGINLIPITVLLFSLALMDNYRERLINLELELLHTQTQLYTKTLEHQDIENLEYDLLKNDQLMIVSNNGDLLHKSPEIEILHHNDEPTLFTKIVENFTDSMMILANINYIAPPLPYLKAESLKLFPGVEAALMGNSNISAWTLREGKTLVFTSTSPLPDQNALLVIHHAKNLAQDLSKFQEDIFRVFISILTLSIAFSLYLVGTITNPLRKLAKAAEAIHHSTKQTHVRIPDMSDRGDEIGELSIALNAMVETLWDRMNTIESFAADVSHELKNPITSIKSALETLPKVKNKKDKEQLLNIITFDVDRLDRLITDISKSTRLDIELSQTVMQTINLHTFIKDIVEIYSNRQTVPSKVNVEFLNFLPNDLFITGNRDKLTQVFTNIIDNAISFSSNGDTVSISTSRDTLTTTISIQDMGPGINDEKCTKIFDRFYSNRPKKEGADHHSGLGLSIVKQIINAHDGKIVARNIKDNRGKHTGAVFDITLPLNNID